MIARKTLQQAIAEGGYIDRAKFESFTDADIERMIDEDPDLAPRTETLTPYLEAEVREKLGLTPTQFADRFGLPLATIEKWERDGTPGRPGAPGTAVHPRPPPRTRPAGTGRGSRVK